MVHWPTIFSLVLFPGIVLAYTLLARKEEKQMLERFGDELIGSTITITSLGMLGGVASTPIINYPEVAVVGTSRIAERPVVRGGAIAIRKMMNLCSSFDHRVVDGWNAASFIQDVKRLLEQPALLFVE